MTEYTELAAAVEMQKMLESPTGIKKEVAYFIHGNSFPVNFGMIRDEFEGSLYSAMAALHSLVKEEIVTCGNGREYEITQDLVFKYNTFFSIAPDLCKSISCLKEVEKDMR